MALAHGKYISFKARKEYDLRSKEVGGLINYLENSKQEMYERRKKIKGFDMIFAEGKIPLLLSEVLNSYIIGNFSATIALCSMAIERFCYDFIDFVDFRISDKHLDSEARELLYNIPIKNWWTLFGK